MHGNHSVNLDTGELTNYGRVNEDEKVDTTPDSDEEMWETSYVIFDTKTNKITMNEPTAGLDPKQRVIIRKLIEKLGDDRIILVSTHIVSDIESIAKEILLIRSGEHTLEELYLQYYGGDAT